jgi:hypothetical protein
MEPKLNSLDVIFTESAIIVERIRVLTDWT